MKTVLALILVAAAGVSLAPQEPAAKAASPEARQEAFMASLAAGEFAKAFDQVLKGSAIADKKDQVANLRDQAEKGSALYGGIVGWESMGIVRQEKHQAFGVALLCCKGAPLHFYFIWYRATEAAPWTLVNVWFSDSGKDYWQLRK